MQSPRLTHLRQATASLHEDLERQVEAAQYFGSLPAYRIYLQRMHGFYREFESTSPAVDCGLGVLSPARDRIGWLEEDLAALGIPALARTHGAAEEKPSAAHDVRSEFLGGLYVICGASLGARLLVQKTAALDLPERCGQSYFTNVATAKDWKRYLEALEQAPSISIAPLKAGAVRTFGDIRRHLCEGSSQ